MLPSTKQNVVLYSLIFVFLSCQTAPKSDAPSLGTDSREVQNSPECEQGRKVEKWILGQLSSEELRVIQNGCRVSGRSNFYCAAYQKSAAITRKLRENERVPRPTPPPPAAPIPIEVKNGRIVKASQMRRAKVSSLLAGIADYPLDRLKTIAELSLKEKFCPANTAIAAAATLEDHLSEESNLSLIANLYEKAAQCARRQPQDRENFLTRAGLFHYLNKDYKKAVSNLAQVHAQDAFSGRSVFWLAKSKAALGDTQGAEVAFQKLRRRHPFSFHNLVASSVRGEDPGSAYLLEQETFKRRSHKIPHINAHLLEVEALSACGLTTAQHFLADWVVDSFPRVEPEVRMYLASLGDDHTKVSTMQELLYWKPSYRNRKTMELAFPTAYFKQMESAASGVDPYLLLAIARKESTLNPRAVSPANAQGLLQLNPDTAVKLTSPEGLNLLNPEKNIQLGAKYVGILSGMLTGQLPLIIAAYNAGEHVVSRWTRRYPTTDILLFVDLIPYRETREYVGFVLSNYYWYRRIYTGNGMDSLKKALGSALTRIEPDALARKPGSYEPVEPLHPPVDNAIDPTSPTETP